MSAIKKLFHAKIEFLLNNIFAAKKEGLQKVMPMFSPIGLQATNSEIILQFL